MGKRTATTSAPGRERPARRLDHARAARPDEPRPPAWGALALVGLVLAAYAPALNAGFIWDDHYWLSWNPVAKAARAPWGYWVSADTADYLPLTGTCFWLQQRLWGNHPAGYHAVNLALHAGASVALWRLLHKLDVPGSLTAAMIFAVHPVAVASVAWIAEQKNTLSMVLMLCALLAYLRFEDCGRPGRYAAALALFAAAALAKGSVVIAPAVLIGMAWWRRGRVTWQDLLRSLPFWVLAAAGATMTVLYQHGNYADDPVDYPVGVVERGVLMGRCTWFYLCKALLPVNLAAVYPRWDVHAVTPGGAAASAALAAAIAVLLVFARRRWARPLTFGLGYYFVALLPVLGLVNIGYMVHSFVADHWHYLALPGPIALVVGLARRHLRRLGPAARPAGPAIALAAVAVLGTLTHVQARAYRDMNSLWRHTVAINPRALAARIDLGHDAARHGRTREAIEHYREVADQRPQWRAELEHRLGVMFGNAGQHDSAIEHFAAALSADANWPDGHKRLAEAHANAGAELVRRGRPADAVAHYRQAADLVPEDPRFRHGLGWALVRDGRHAEAVAPLEQALSARPDWPEVHFLLAQALDRTGQARRAAEHYRLAGAATASAVGP